MSAPSLEVRYVEIPPEVRELGARIVSLSSRAKKEQTQHARHIWYKRKYAKAAELLRDYPESVRVRKCRRDILVYVRIRGTRYSFHLHRKLFTQHVLNDGLGRAAGRILQVALCDDLAWTKVQ